MPQALQLLPHVLDITPRSSGCFPLNLQDRSQSAPQKNSASHSWSCTALYSACLLELPPPDRKINCSEGQRHIMDKQSGPGCMCPLVFSWPSVILSSERDYTCKTLLAPLKQWPANEKERLICRLSHNIRAGIRTLHHSGKGTIRRRIVRRHTLHRGLARGKLTPAPSSCHSPYS